MNTILAQEPNVQFTKREITKNIQEQLLPQQTKPLFVIPIPDHAKNTAQVTDIALIMNATVMKDGLVKLVMLSAQEKMY